MAESFYTKLKLAKGEIPEIPQYESVSSALRNQFFMIIQSADISDELGGKIIEYLREEFGLKYLSKPSYTYRWAWYHELEGFLDGTTDNDQVLAVFELFGRALARSQSLLKRLNERMRNAGLGYVHTGETLIRVNDESFFNNATLPALGLLAQEGYSHARTEYLKSYTLLRDGHFNDAINASVRALESLLKTRLGIQSSEKILLNVLVEKFKGRVDTSIGSFNSHFTKIIDLVENVAAPRNNNSHGKPEGSPQVDEVYVRFVINQVAASLLFVAELKINDTKQKQQGH